MAWRCASAFMRCLALIATSVVGQDMGGVEGMPGLTKAMSGEQMRMLHTVMDTDSNDQVSLEEGSKFVRELRMSVMLKQGMPIMQNMDTNNDGQLSLEEFKADLQHISMDEDQKELFVEKFGSFDDDGDELLSTTEVQPLFTFMFRFKSLDRNGDGVLSMKEFKKIAAKKLNNAPPEEVEKSDDEGKLIFARLDEDGDKLLNPKEHFTYESGISAGLSAWETLFEISDTNGDKLVSADELVEARGHQKFGGQAAFHHSQDWINKIEEALEEHRKQGGQGGQKGEEL